MSGVIVQSALAPSADGKITLGAAPTNGNWLIAIVPHWSFSPAIGTGWTRFHLTNASGDGSASYYKLCGAGESTNQQPTTDTVQMDIAMWEIAGLTGVWATDFQQVQAQADLVTTPSYTTSSFNTSAANTMILGIHHGNVGTTTTETGPPTFTGGHASVTDQSGVYNGGVRRNTATAMFHDLFPTNLSAVQYVATFPINQSQGHWEFVALNWGPASSPRVQIIKV